METKKISYFISVLVLFGMIGMQASERRHNPHRRSSSLSYSEKPTDLAQALGLLKKKPYKEAIKHL